jgi:hypothetical protein
MQGRETDTDAISCAGTAGQEELRSLAQEGLRGAVCVQPRVPVPVVRQVRLRGRRACHAGARGAGLRRHVAGGSIPAQPQCLGSPSFTGATNVK